MLNSLKSRNYLKFFKMFFVTVSEQCNSIVVTAFFLTLNGPVLSVGGRAKLQKLKLLFSAKGSREIPGLRGASFPDLFDRGRGWPAKVRLGQSHGHD